MKYSGIGGQAVMEGVMMQNKDTYAVAVRKPDHEIDVKVSKRKNSKTLDAIRKIPILRGVVSFVDSLYLGMSTLVYSASTVVQVMRCADTMTIQYLIFAGIR